jgi:hypothetical protein
VEFFGRDDPLHGLYWTACVETKQPPAIRRDVGPYFFFGLTEFRAWKTN